jgi:hypothetical protein
MTDRKVNREAQRKWYASHKHEQSVRVMDDRKKTRNLVDNIKGKSRCIECGESHPACLDFHHRDSSTKLFDLSRRSINGVGRKRILEEIEKCDVLCSNCHRKKHWEQRNKKGLDV